MIRNRLLSTFSRLNLSRTFDLKENRRCLQRTTVRYKNYYVERNDDLLDIDEVLKTKSKRGLDEDNEIDQNDNSQFKYRKSFRANNLPNYNPTKPFKSLKRSKIESKEGKLNSKEYMQSYFKIDPLVRQQFV